MQVSVLIVALKSLLKGCILQFAIYGIKRWVLKLPNWSSPTEVRFFMLNYKPYITEIIKATETKLDDIGLAVVYRVVESPVLFEIAWAMFFTALPNKPSRMGLLERIRNSRSKVNDDILESLSTQELADCEKVSEVIRKIRTLGDQH